jgi:hypothetical protein
MNMIPIIPSMPFLAFPSEKVLAEFQPVRGLLVTAPLPGGADNRPAADFQSHEAALTSHPIRSFGR